jgi:3-dehydroquinate dehydratase / shikimate dehydrogenase
MICISIAQESRRLALADLFNASGQCDLVEIRLDCFENAPDIAELIGHKRGPVIMTCRREQDGGQWKGSEEERLALLRQCIISKADYVEIELDAADQIRRYPPSQRVISYTNLSETPPDIDEIYEEMQTKNADVIKLTTLARTPEEAWPLVQIVAKQRVPTVVVGLGKPGVLLSVLGKKIGAPWTYAALERGMEAYPGQPTVTDLKEVYHYPAIEKTTRLIGVTGFGKRDYLTVAALNAALAHYKLPARCLPMGVGNVRVFRKVMEAVKLAGVVIDEEHRRSLFEIAEELDQAAEQTGAVDMLLLSKHNKWHGFNTQACAAVAALEAVLAATSRAPQPLQGRLVMIAGINAMARTMAQSVQQRGGAVILASHDRNAVQALAAELQCRHVLFDAIYTTMHDVLIVCDEEKDQSPRKEHVGIHAGYLKPGMTVMDLTAALSKSPLLREAESRGCAIVAPKQLLLDHLAAQAKMLAHKEVPHDVLFAAMPAFTEEDA